MLIRMPQSWPDAVTAGLAMVALALLDLAGAYLAKEAVLRRSAGFGIAGGLLFVLLFWVYASSLQYAELAPVTVGWIVVLQVGVVLLDRWRYGSALPAGKWAALVLIVAAQLYLLLGPTGAAAGGSSAPVAGPVSAGSSAVP